MRRAACLVFFLLLALLFLALLVPGLAASVPPAGTAAPRDAFDPRALQLLQKMNDAYAQTETLDQSTVYYSALIPLQPPALIKKEAKSEVKSEGDKANEPQQQSDPDVPTPQDQKMERSLRLIVMPPNLLRLEMQEPDPRIEHGQRTSIWDCDGKTFWTYAPDTQYYTKEKSPSRRSDFAKLRHLNTGSLELMMILGLNPFAHIRDEADGAQLGRPETVRGALTDVVVLKSVALSSITRVRLYIDHESGLLRRLSVETRPIKYTPPPEPGRVGDEMDALVTRRKPVPLDQDASAVPQTITRVTYDNLFGPPQSVNLTDFVFKIPPNALLYAPFEMGKPLGPSLKEMLHNINPLRGAKLHIIKP